MMRAQGKTDALSLRSRSAGMDGTAIIAEEEKIPAFNPEKDYSSWPAGAPVADEGQVWTLIQPYNAANYDGRPSTLRALWGLAHTKDPAKAKPYVAPFGTSGLYAKDECCTDPDAEDPAAVYRSKCDGNAYSPSAYPATWPLVGGDTSCFSASAVAFFRANARGAINNA